MQQRQKLTKQGVRDLNGFQKNGRRTPDTQVCPHDYDHDPECTGCYAQQLGAAPHASHRYVCKLCGDVLR